MKRTKRARPKCKRYRMLGMYKYRCGLDYDHKGKCFMWLSECVERRKGK